MCAICNFKIEFSVSHPSALTVAVATRAAIESGLVSSIDSTDGALAAARQRLSAVEALSLFQARVEQTYSPEALLALPDFYVLLIETDTLGFFQATANGFDPDVIPDYPDLSTDDEASRSSVIVTSEALLRACLAGAVSIDVAAARSMMIFDAAADNARQLHEAFAHAMSPDASNQISRTKEKPAACAG
jgi:hypothetical protein